jgi:myo-inositol-1(or 4)-monophosphatase
MNLLGEVASVVRNISDTEILPRYLKVARLRKADGSLFTEADLAVQDALRRELSKINPVPLIGEEMDKAEQTALWNSGEIWCVDPIDGTSNFVNGIPYFAVSVALMQNGRSVLGAVYNPVSKEMFTATKGGGAYLDGEKLPLRHSGEELKGSIAAADFKRLSKALAGRLAVSPPYSSQRNFGACSLEWCYAAAGRVDLYLHGGQKLWDYAAGALILEESGGFVSCIDQDDFWDAPPWTRSAIAAGNRSLFEKWRNWIRESET